MKTTVWAVRDAETGEQISGLFSFKRDAEKRLKHLDFMGRPLEVYRTTQDLPPPKP
jgi:hypothetical protein